MPSSPSRFSAGTLHVGEGQLSGVLSVQADLVQVPAALEPLHAAFDDQQRKALRALVSGSVWATTITRSELIPLVMNVFDPLST